MEIKINVIILFLFLNRFVITFIITIKDLFTRKEVIITEGKNYTCNGNFLIQVCAGKDYE